MKLKTAISSLLVVTAVVTSQPGAWAETARKPFVCTTPKAKDLADAITTKVESAFFARCPECTELKVKVNVTVPKVTTSGLLTSGSATVTGVDDGESAFFPTLVPGFRIRPSGCSVKASARVSLSYKDTHKQKQKSIGTSRFDVVGWGE